LKIKKKARAFSYTFPTATEKMNMLPRHCHEPCLFYSPENKKSETESKVNAQPFKGRTKLIFVCEARSSIFNLQ